MDEKLEEKAISLTEVTIFSVVAPPLLGLAAAAFWSGSFSYAASFLTSPYLRKLIIGLLVLGLVLATIAQLGVRRWGLEVRKVLTIAIIGSLIGFLYVFWDLLGEFANA